MVFYLFVNAEDPEYCYHGKGEFSIEALRKLNDVYYIYRINLVTGLMEEFLYGSGDWKELQLVDESYMLGT